MKRRGILQEWMGFGHTDFPIIVRWIWSNLKDFRVFLLSGNMGSGKTSFVRVFLRFLGLADADFEGSPTYSYYNIYPLPAVHKNFLVIHVDMAHVAEGDVDFQGQFEDLQLLDSLLFIENYNPQKGLLLNNYVNIFFEEESNGKRKIRIEGPIG